MDRRAFGEELLNRLKEAAVALPAASTLLTAACAQVNRIVRDRIALSGGNPQANKELIKRGEVSAEGLFDYMRNLLALKPDREPVVAEGPMSPIVILLRDRHGSPMVEYRILEQLKRHLGIDFVGVEGWSGQEEISEYTLSGERDLTMRLLKEDEFKVHPLEEAELSRKRDLAAGANFGLYYLLVKEGFFDGMDEMLKVYGGNAPHLRALYAALQSFYPLDTDLAKEVEAKANDKNLTLKGIFDSFERIFEREKVQNWFNEGLEILDFDLSQLKRLPGESVKEHRLRLLRLSAEVLDNLINGLDTQRSIAGAEKMLKQMHEAGERVGVMIFGAGHTDKIVEVLRQRNCSIFVVREGQE